MRLGTQLRDVEARPVMGLELGHGREHLIPLLLGDQDVELDLERDVTRNVEPSPGLRPALVAVYRNHPALAELCERLVDLDEGLQEWRYRHVKMVQRTIGTRHGTGGSTGAEYLMTTLNKPLFPDLWATRTEL